MFGAIWSGAPAIGVLIALTVVALLLARETFRQRAIGWWGVIVLLCLCSISVLITHARHTDAEFLERAGMPPEQVQAVQAMEVNTGGWYMIITGISIAITIGFLIRVRRYFNVGHPAVFAPEAPAV